MVSECGGGQFEQTCTIGHEASDGLLIAIQPLSGMDIPGLQDRPDRADGREYIKRGGTGTDKTLTSHLHTIRGRHVERQLRQPLGLRHGGATSALIWRRAEEMRREPELTSANLSIATCHWS